jgi:hypothetical protein
MDADTIRYAARTTITEGNEPGRLLEFIHLDHIRDQTGNWVYRPTTDFKIQSDGAYSEYSFSVIRNWDPSGTMILTKLQSSGY